MENPENGLQNTGLPYRTLRELRDAVSRGDVDLGVPMDYARQWLINQGGNKRWRIQAALAEIIQASPLWLAVGTAYMFWGRVGPAILGIVIPIAFAWMAFRPMVLRLNAMMRLLAGLAVVAFVAGLLVGNLWLALSGGLMTSQWLLNNFLYRFSSRSLPTGSS
ncbi:MAG: hypothetical protein EXR58_06420 [Chloroflexi bacterium]|nr:hypothetical protein [Chloroflexota bacterium]